ncbi:MAG: hypothetical protein E6J72_05755 [Deltaproteobacteria bacterium]|nr:MAG: hypothetical protein E6J72_05755 [Deltaproteobacteria bacterium]
MLAIPLVADDEPLGVLVFGDHRAGRFASGVAEEAPVLGSLAAATLRNLEVLAKLQDANEQLRRVAALKDQFLANVSHDLRTPLNVIIGYAQLAIEETFGAVDDAQRDVWTRVLASARQQLALVEDLLDISRLELGTLAVTLQPVAVAPLFEEMKFVASTLVRQKDVRVRVGAVAPGLTVHADPNRMRQILTNLLSNAAKFTDVGEIELTAMAGDGTVRIAVRDTGAGIDPQHHGLVFEPFRQIAGERAMLGAGLGLGIARHLATLMHGTLSVVSAVGRGSTAYSATASTATSRRSCNTATRTSPTIAARPSTCSGCS